MFSKVSQYQAKRFLDKEWDEQKELRKYITSLNIDWSTGWLMIDDTVIEKVNVTKHCNRYYVTNMTENRITSQQIVNEYRVRWKIEVLFRNLKHQRSVYEAKKYFQQKFIGIKYNGNKALRLNFSWLLKLSNL